ncbi:hypothetical protein [Pseudomonas sp. CFBP 13719]|uniref:hypothetical protein n=1 Tax=Pseudomonas sp. CFBP 13719 TaxID=2775303 RepID=UPI001782DE9E|nr:hypothetical protein [Pseudomonas sp. CFBP 13719]MBD8683951.1 hypothetical protein [Pseudomonas sp. CFBP 13719]
MLVPQWLTVAFIVREAMKAEFETDGQLVTSHLEGHLERLQMRHTLGNTVDDQMIPLHVQ